MIEVQLQIFRRLKSDITATMIHTLSRSATLNDFVSPLDNITSQCEYHTVTIVVLKTVYFIQLI